MAHEYEPQIIVDLLELKINQNQREAKTEFVLNPSIQKTLVLCSRRAQPYLLVLTSSKKFMYLNIVFNTKYIQNLLYLSLCKIKLKFRLPRKEALN